MQISKSCGYLVAAWMLFAAPVLAQDPGAPETSIQFLKAWGTLGTAPGQFNLPVGIALDTAGTVFVTDHYNDRIQHFDADGTLLRCFPVLPCPSGIGVDDAGLLYVTHFAAGAQDMNKPDTGDFVTVYTEDGTLVRQWGKRGTGDGEFNCPGGVAIGKDGRVYIADQTNHRVQVFDKMGTLLLKWGEYGNETGQFGGKDSSYSRTGGPQFVALDAAGNVWTSEGMNCRIQKFSPEGKYLLSWGDSEDTPGTLGGYFALPDGTAGRLQGPIALYFDAKDRLWISSVAGRVQQFAQDGTFLRGIGSGQGDAPGQFYIPHGIAIDPQGHLYVADALNHRIQKFQIPRSE